MKGYAIPDVPYALMRAVPVAGGGVLVPSPRGILRFRGQGDVVQVASVVEPECASFVASRHGTVITSPRELVVLDPQLKERWRTAIKGDFELQFPEKAAAEAWIDASGTRVFLGEPRTRQIRAWDVERGTYLGELGGTIARWSAIRVLTEPAAEIQIVSILFDDGERQTGAMQQTEGFLAQVIGEMALGICDRGRLVVLSKGETAIVGRSLPDWEVRWKAEGGEAESDIALGWQPAIVVPDERCLALGESGRVYLINQGGQIWPIRLEELS